MSARGSGAPLEDLVAPDWVDGALDRRLRERRSGVQTGAAGYASPERRTASRKRGESSDEAATGSIERRDRTALLALSGPAMGRLLMFATVTLLLFGLVMAYSSSTYQAYYSYGSSWYFLQRQLIWAAVGVAVMVVLSRIDYTLWRKLALPAACAVAALLVLVAFPGVGATVNGARRWIDLGFTTLQPSELAKPAAILLAAAMLAAGVGKPITLRLFVRVMGLVVVPLALLILIGKDLSTTIILVMTVAGVLVVAGARWKHLLVLGAVLPVAAVGLILLEPYRTARVLSFLDPWEHADTSGFQATQSLIAVASGRVFGVGLGNSVQKSGFLPEQTTDMITGIIGEELGLVGLLLLVALYGVLAWAGLRLALACREPFARLVTAGFTITVVGQALLNLGAAMGLLPILGVPLPLVSCGGTSLLVVLAGVGIMLNIAGNRRSYIVVTPQRRRRPRSSGGHRGPHGPGTSGR